MLIPIQKISLNILAHIRTSMSTAKAVDAVLGVGTYATLADNLYDALREKAGQ